MSLRILADHARAMTFLVSDGVFPSNEDRGYVLRRIIRRAVRHAYLLGVEAVITPAMVDEVVAVMGEDYPELAESHDVRSARRSSGRRPGSGRPCAPAPPSSTPRSTSSRPASRCPATSPSTCTTPTASRWR